MNGIRTVLITGSRDWKNRDAIQSVIEDEYGIARDNNKVLMVRHGAHRTGADHFAKLVVYSFHCSGFTETILEDPMPADWTAPCTAECSHKPCFKNGRPVCLRQGPLRNQRMVDKGADICHAFPLKGSRGTWDCIRRAAEAGITVIVHDPKGVNHVEVSRFRR